MFNYEMSNLSDTHSSTCLLKENLKSKQRTKYPPCLLQASPARFDNDLFVWSFHSTINNLIKNS